MQLSHLVRILRSLVLFNFLFTWFSCFGQTTYFHQNFSKTTSLINPQPDTSQFSHIILTSPVLSYHKFHKGYMELVRTQQDSASGGIIRILRATPFLPNPKTLIIRIKLSAEAIQSNSVNAIYLYVGENFDPVNNSFPGNGNMFGRCSINFLGNAFNVKDLENQLAGDSIKLKKVVTLTWALNNSDKAFTYDVSNGTTGETVEPGKYDLWIDDKPINKGSNAYPGSSPYSETKLSNFEIRFRNGLGRIRMYDILITDGISGEELSGSMVMPNPVTMNSFIINDKNIDPATLKLAHISGKQLPFESTLLANDRVKIVVPQTLSPGIYLLYFTDRYKKRKSVKFLVQ
ncbi:T9SS type A sorting domain-containing protein [Dyadobacter sp. CY323]|uniref:T9SS type A sorting domain-containing protein n=1 Tax=Dyadobacter sp. CY323 TaxID=2907302 RepID=UPI001F1CF392|nr:T9SS type A sorting domain-containing protein [Dyadobacter sp. CY323]MCE6990836.1 T9SS type A sorting domain-containing protein [Dyadobacter sp. CY323]